MSRNGEFAERLASELQKLGIDLETPEGQERFRANLQWAEENRIRCDRYRTHAALLFVGSIAAAAGTTVVSWGADLLEALRSAVR